MSTWSPAQHRLHLSLSSASGAFAFAIQKECEYKNKNKNKKKQSALFISVLPVFLQLLHLQSHLSFGFGLPLDGLILGDSELLAEVISVGLLILHTLLELRHFSLG